MRGLPQRLPANVRSNWNFNRNCSARRECLQLTPLSARHLLAHLERHCGVLPFNIAARIRNAIDLRGDGVPVELLRIKQASELSLFLFQIGSKCFEIESMAGESSLDSPSLFLRQTQPGCQRGVRPPCATAKLKIESSAK